MAIADPSGQHPADAASPALWWAEAMPRCGSTSWRLRYRVWKCESTLRPRSGRLGRHAGESFVGGVVALEADPLRHSESARFDHLIAFLGDHEHVVPSGNCRRVRRELGVQHQSLLGGAGSHT